MIHTRLPLCNLRASDSQRHTPSETPGEQQSAAGQTASDVTATPAVSGERRHSHVSQRGRRQLKQNTCGSVHRRNYAAGCFLWIHVYVVYCWLDFTSCLKLSVFLIKALFV